MMMNIYQFQKTISGLSTTKQKEILDRARVVVENPKIEKCEGCGQLPLLNWRSSRKYCNNACKQKAYRARKQHE